MIAFSANAQVKIGALLGVNLFNSFNKSYQSNYPPYTYLRFDREARSFNVFDGGRLGYNAGLFVSFPIYKRVELQTGVSYEKVSGGVSFNSYSGYPGEYEVYIESEELYRYTYLNIPLLFAYKFKSMEHLSVILGSQFSIGLESKGTLKRHFIANDYWRYTTKLTDIETDLKYLAVDTRTPVDESGTGMNRYFYRYNVSVCAGVGYDFKYCSFKVLYTLGCINTVAATDYELKSYKSYLHGINMTMYLNVFTLAKK